MIDGSKLQQTVSALALIGVVLAVGTALSALLAAAIPYLKGSDRSVKITTLLAGALGALGAVVGIFFYHYSDDLDRSRAAES
jgi:membrane associated rhomboid family serine protease